MTVDKLKSKTKDDLAQMAKKRGVKGWHSMRKDQLVKALASAMRKSSSKSKTKKKSTAKKKSSKRSAPSRRSASAKRKTTKKKTAKKKPAKKKATRKSSGSGRKSASRKSASSKTKTKKKSTAKKKPARKSTAAKKKPAKKSAKKSTKPKPRRSRELGRVKEKLERTKNLAYSSGRGKRVKDSLELFVRDPFWLHAVWELNRTSVKRAQTALNQDWHTAKPVLRLYQISESGSSSTSDTLIRTIAVHGGVKNWFIDVTDPPKSYRAEIGYLAASKFFMLARSNVVTTPRAGATEPADERFGENEDFGQNYHDRMGRTLTRYFPLSINGQRKREFKFDLDARLVVYGATEPGAHVTLQGDPVELRSDGTFTVDFRLQDGRQIIPARAESADGGEQRTIVLAVERNTKVMEPIVQDNDR